MRKFITALCYIRFNEPLNVNLVHTMSQKNIVTSKDEIPELMALWPDVVKNITESSQYSEIPDVASWSKKMLEYNMSDGKMFRASNIINAFNQLARPDQLTDDNMRLARILGWCIEMLQTHFLMLDDIMDHSKTRRGKVCWHLREDIGLAGIKDGILMEQMVYQLLRMHFGQKPYYLDLLDTIHDTVYKTIMGQALDLLSTNHGKKPNLKLFTMERYSVTTKYKAAYYTFVMPLQLAMYLTGIKDNDTFKQAKSVLMEMGNFYQVNDDYLDFFGDPKATGKLSSDIQEGKCTWLVVVALQRVILEQRKILEDCYGENDPEKVARVKELYHELGLQKIYSDYQEKTYNSIKAHIQQISCEVPHDYFFEMLDKFHYRNK